jgi:subtilisin family serine protease
VTQPSLRAAALALLLLGLFFPSAGFAGPGAPADASGATLAPDASPGRLIVSFAERNLTEAQARGRLARHGVRLERYLPELGLARVTVAPGTERALAQRLQSEAGVAFATEDRQSVSVAGAPLDERWGEQWGPQRVGLAEAREVTQGDRGVVIAIVDTGVNYTHWDLREQMWINPGESEVDDRTGDRTCQGGIAQNGLDDDGNGYVDDCFGYDFDSGSADPRDVFGHGTVVAGIAGAATNNRGSRTDGTYEGIAGMGGASRLMALRVLNAGGRGWPFNIAEAIRYAVDSGAAVVNLSLTLGTSPYPDDVAMLCAATSYARSRNVLVVAASGNDSYYSLKPVSYPAACEGVIAVGASTDGDTRAVFSNASERLDLVAPGQGITSTLHTSDTAYGFFGLSGSGTSFATPHVAGAAALVRAMRPAWTPQQISDLLRLTAYDLGEPGFDSLTGWGRLDVARAVQHAAHRVYLPILGNP